MQSQLIVPPYSQQALDQCIRTPAPIASVATTRMLKTNIVSRSGIVVEEPNVLNWMGSWFNFIPDRRNAIQEKANALAQIADGEDNGMDANQVSQDLRKLQVDTIDQVTAGGGLLLDALSIGTSAISSGIARRSISLAGSTGDAFEFASGKLLDVFLTASLADPLPPYEDVKDTVTAGLSPPSIPAEPAFSDAGESYPNIQVAAEVEDTWATLLEDIQAPYDLSAPWRARADLSDSLADQARELAEGSAVETYAQYLGNTAFPGWNKADTLQQEEIWTSFRDLHSSYHSLPATDLIVESASTDSLGNKVCGGAKRAAVTTEKRQRITAWLNTAADVDSIYFVVGPGECLSVFVETSAKFLLKVEVASPAAAGTWSISRSVVGWPLWRPALKDVVCRRNDSNAEHYVVSVSLALLTHAIDSNNSTVLFGYYSSFLPIQYNLTCLAAPPGAAAIKEMSMIHEFFASRKNRSATSNLGAFHATVARYNEIALSASGTRVPCFIAIVLAMVICFFASH